MSEIIEKAVEIADGNYWLGFTDTDSAFRTNAYLIKNKDVMALVDAGSIHHFKTIHKQVSGIAKPENIKFFIQHHQDPDLCASLPLWEEKIGPRKIIAHTKVNILIYHYGVKSDLVNIDLEGWELDLGGRVLKFLFMPYMHSPGEIMTYDTSTKVLFSGDIFGGLSMDWSLYANEDYFEAMAAFMENYMPSSEIVQNNLKKLEGLEIKTICPQHGSMIPEAKVAECIETLRNLECGSYLYE